MYTGTINKKPHYNKNPFRFKIQMVTQKPIELNGSFTNELEFKTKEYKTDKNISYRDFDIKNLQAINALGQLKPVQMQKSIDMVEKEAHTANKVMEQIEFIKNLEQEENGNNN